MSQWDGQPENPPTMLLGKRGRKAWNKVIETVVAAQKPPTDNQMRAINEARAAMVVEVVQDPEFRPAERVAEIEGQLVEHLRALDGLVGDLAAWKGAQVWTEDARMPYRPAPAVSRGPAAQALRRSDAVSAANLVSALFEVLNVTPIVDGGVQQVAEHATNPHKATPQQFGRYARAAA